jgi:hypothetical protein
MTQSSIGSSPGNDSNENHSGGGPPPKTMGEETQAPPSTDLQQDATQEVASGATGNELSSAEEVLPVLPIHTAAENPGDFPDGPNVAPSPWEKDAAQGNG